MHAFVSQLSHLNHAILDDAFHCSHKLLVPHTKIIKQGQWGCVHSMSGCKSVVNNVQMQIKSELALDTTECEECADKCVIIFFSIYGGYVYISIYTYIYLQCIE